ncbi:MAG: carbon-nitrogen hydrolase family protein [Phycisphaeraceae bacterium]
MWWIHSTGIVAAIALLVTFAAPPARADSPQRDPGPRKVVVGTTIYSIWQGWPGLDARLAELGAMIDEMAATARDQYDTGLDLAVLTEYAVTAGRPGDAAEVALPLHGPVLDYFAEKAREHETYIIIPMILEEDRGQGIYTNAAVLVDRQGELAGIYRKVHPVAAPSQTVLEGGLTPGTEHAVFDTDFGRLGIQICWDMAYDEGWHALAEHGAEIVAWPSASPQTIRPTVRAREGGYYIVSSTPRNNATVFYPTGQVAAQIESDASLESAHATLVTQIDLDYEILGWQARLNNGALFDNTYGDRAGYHYSPREDGGVFWSNDPATPIAEMIKELGLELSHDSVERNRRLRDRIAADAPTLAPAQGTADAPPAVGAAE